MTAAAWVCLFSPLAAALAITLLGNLPSRRTTGYIATGSTFVSFVAAVVAFVQLLDREGEERRVVSTAWTWLTAGDFSVSVNILVDPLSVMMMLVVSGVGSLIVGYSIGYMHDSDEERRYFAYMALFVFSMLLLVQSANFLMLLVGWGLVGLSSYLLIGYHQERPSAIEAAKKAFVMNAFGDATMALALFVMIQRTGSLDLGPVFENVEALGDGWALNLVALGLLGGAVAKSAQIPLHTWLPDAMEGPTPVSALIHAATMVTAGVYLIVRCHPIFESAEGVADLAAILGAGTLLVAGLVALVQVDIKRVIAYSTMSQIGYMFLGAGLGAYASGMFHLMTHAFFKALLFLAAGIVIHALAGEQDMRRMGGLRALLPRTAIAMTIGGLALAGIPPLAGFFSKDSILASALARGGLGYVLFAAGLAGALLTGIYTFRMIYIVFGGETSAETRAVFDEHHGRGEGPFWMVWTVAALAVLTVVGGWIQFAGLWHPLSDWLNGSVFVEREHLNLVEPTGTQDAVTSVIAVGLGLTGIFVAWWLYGARRRPVPRWAFAQRTLEHKFHFDELYDVVFYKPAALIPRVWTALVEQPLVRGSMYGVALGARGAGREVGEAQTGYLRLYAMAIAAGLAVLAIVFLSVR